MRFDPATARRRLAELVGEANVSASPLMVTPGSIDEVCEVMKLACSEGWTTMPAGAMTWLGIDAALKQVNIIVSTRRLDRVIEHEPADLVAITEAGVTLKNFNAHLSLNRQWLPIDPPDDGSGTIGGVVATGLGGAQQLGYGPPRRHVIGMKVVMADGSLVKAGSRVVKNVAGYDLCKLFTGSYGTLGIIVEVNFKLRPLPFVTRTVLLAGPAEEMLRKGLEFIKAQLFSVAVELISPHLGLQITEFANGESAILMVRFAGSQSAVAAQVASARHLFESDDDSIRLLEDDEALWADLALAPIRFSKHVMWRVGLRTTEAASFLLDLIKTSDQAIMWHAGLGDGRVRVIDVGNAQHGDAHVHVDRLREKAAALGGALIMETALASRFADVNAKRPDHELMVRIKQQLDPLGTFSPGPFGLEMNLTEAASGRS